MAVAVEAINQGARLPTEWRSAFGAPAPEVDDAALRYFVRRCTSLVRLDLGSYKQEQVKRRLGGLIHAAGARSVAEFAQKLAEDEQAVARFKAAFTIHVTEFFRDPDAYNNLATLVVPTLAQLGRPADVWSAGCSLGAEPLSLAMMLDRSGAKVRRLVATDVCPTTVRRARAGGPFDVREVKNLTEGDLAYHLEVRDDGNFWVCSPLHDRIDFRVHDLIGDPYPGPFDLVVCRNVLIYFVDEVKNSVLARLAGAVRPGGFLFLGGTEIVHSPEALGLIRRYPSLYEKAAR
ncbi:MAG TPA: protein-glutamate O-methyltransferase CheR [Chloroflexota bacterium]|jgi:chemotaxis protein methyltransferase CheR|nr:protein-glutamate O-methyltransferase CheR [Chloroflexota bacterium]